MVAKTLKIVFFLFIVLAYKASNLYARKDFAVGTQIYDAQINEDLKTLLAPLAEKAGIDIRQSRLYIIINPVYNAWATVDNTFGLHTGFLRKCETVEQFLSVMAHEFGHVNARHIARSEETFGRIAKQGMIVTGLAALGGLLAGRPDAAAASIIGGMSVIERGMLGYSRAQEHTADQAAVAFLKSLNWPVSAFKDAMMVMKKESLFYTPGNTYLSTHPPTSERIEYLGSSLESSSTAKVPDNYKGIWDRLQLKIRAFTDEPEDLIKELGADDSDNALFTRSISHYRLDQSSLALDCINKLLQKYPNNPHYHALKAEIFWADGHIKESLNEYLTAQQLMPDELEYKIGYATALIELKQDLNKAIELLEDVALNNKRISNAWKLLIEAYGAQNRQGELAWAHAEYSRQVGEIEKAKEYAAKAEKLLSKESRYYLFLTVLSDQLKEEK